LNDEVVYKKDFFCLIAKPDFFLEYCIGEKHRKKLARGLCPKKHKVFLVKVLRFLLKTKAGNIFVNHAICIDKQVG